MQIFHLLKDNAVIFTGTNAEVFEKLLTTQPQSTAFALQHGGYKIEPTTHTTERADRLRCDECGNKHYDVDGDMLNYKLIADVGLCLACVTEENND